MMGCGEQCVIVTGAHPMHRLCVDSLDTQVEV